MNPCKITEDLLPLYVEGTCSPGSQEYVEEHVKTCPQCKALLDSMKQPVAVELPKQNAEKSFRSLSRRLILQRVLLITLCTLIALTGTIAALWHPLIKPYFFYTHYFALDSIDAQLSRLSDGSVYVRLTYTGDEHATPSGGVEYGSEGEYIITFQYTRLRDILLPADSGYTYEFIMATAESQYVYSHMMTHAVSLSFVGADGRQLLWQEGDELPPADAEAETALQREIESGRRIPIEEWREKIESGEIQFG